MNAIDELVHITARIETSGPKGQGSGTGFFLTLCEDDGEHVPLIVTNKHVIKDTHVGQFVMTQGKQGTGWEPMLGTNVQIPLVSPVSIQ